MLIITKPSYAHINRSFSGWDHPKGRIVKNKAHYEQLCREQNMIPYEQAQEKAKKNSAGKDYKLTQSSQALINEAKKFKGAKGSFRAKDCPKLIEKMIKKGVVKNNSQYLKYLPAVYQPKGGFTNV